MLSFVCFLNSVSFPLVSNFVFKSFADKRCTLEGRLQKSEVQMVSVSLRNCLKLRLLMEHFED